VKRWLTRAAWLAGFFLLGVIALVLVLQIDAVGRRVVRAGLERMAIVSEADVRSVGGSWVTGLRLEGLHVVAPDLATLDATSVRVTWSLLPLLRKRVHIGLLEVTEPRVQWDGCATTEATDPAEPSAWRVSLDSASVVGGGVEGRMCADAAPYSASDVTFSAAGISSGEQLRARALSVSASLRPPRTAEAYRAEVQLTASLADGLFQIDTVSVLSPRSDVAGSGTFALGEESRSSELRLRLSPLDFQDLQPYAGAWLVEEGSATGRATIGRSGAGTTAVGEIVVTDGGEADFDVMWSAPSPDSVRYVASVQLRDFDPTRVLAQGPASTLDGRLDAEVGGPDLASANGRIGLVLRDTPRPGDARTSELTVDFVDGAGTVEGDVTWAGWHARVEGVVHPFLETPDYDVTADVQAQRPPALAPAGEGDALRGRLQVTGAGVTVDDARLRSTLDIERFAFRRGAVGPLRIDVQVDSSRARAGIEGGVAGGRVSGRVQGALDDGADWAIERLRLTGADLAALLTDSLTSRVDAQLRGAGSGYNTADMTGDVTLTSDSLTWGGTRVRAVSVRTGIRSDGVTARAHVESDVGTVEATLFGNPREDRPGIRITQGRLVGVDVAMFVPREEGSSPWASRLNGTFQGRVADVARLREPGALAQIAADARLVLAASEVGSQDVEGGEVTLALAGGRARMNADLRVPDGRLSFAGAASPFDTLKRVTIDSLGARNINFAALTGSTAWPSLFDGSLSLDGTGRDAASLDGTLRLVVDRARIRDLDVSSTSLSARARAGEVDVDGAVSGPWGRVEVEGRGGLGASAPDFSGQGVFEVSEVAALLGDTARTGDLRGTFDFEATVPSLDSVPLGLLAARGRVDMEAGTFDGVPFDSVRVAASLDDGVARFDSASAWSSAGTIVMSGAVPITESAGGEATLMLSATAGDLSPVADILGLERLWTDSATVDVTVRGPRNDLRIEGELTAAALAAGPLTADRVSATFGGNTLPDRTLGAWNGAARFRTATAAGVRFDSTDVEVAFESSDYRVVFESLVDDRRHVRLSGRFDPAQGGGTLEELNVAVDDDRWTLETEATVATGASPRVDEIVLSAGAQRIEIRGGIDPVGPQDLTISLAAFRLEGIADLVGLNALGGTVDGTLDLRGTADSPVADWVIAADVTDRGVPLGLLSLEAQAEGGVLTLDGGVSEAGGADVLSLRGTLPFRLTLPDSLGEGAAVGVPDGPVDVTFAADSFDLAWLAPFVASPALAAPGGRVVADLYARGTAQAPDLSGTLRLDGGRVGLPLVGLELSQGTMTAALQDDRISIASLSLRSGDGTATGSGDVVLDRILSPQLDLDVHLDRFRGIHNDLASARLSGDVTITGAPLAPVVEGSLDVIESEMHLDAEFASSDVSRVELTDADLRMLEEKFGIVVGDGTAPSGLYEASDLKLRLVLGRDTWARQRSNPEMALQFSGELNVEKRPLSRPEVNGSLLAIQGRSYIRQFGRRFEVESGEVTFSGPLTQARVDLTAVYEVPSRDNPGTPEVTISLTAQGTADTLAINLASEPAMENADIVSYIATGRPAAEGFSGEGGQTALVSAATDQLLGLLQRAAMDLGGLQVVEIRSDASAGTTLVAGQFLSPRLYVGLMQPLSTGSSTQGGTSDERTRAIEIEYEAYRWLILNLQRGGSRIGFYLKSRYAY